MLANNSIYLSKAKTSLKRTKAGSALVMGKDSTEFSIYITKKKNYKILVTPYSKYKL